MALVKSKLRRWSHMGEISVVFAPVYFRAKSKSEEVEKDEGYILK